MQIIRLTFTVMVLILIHLTTLNAQWIKTNGPYGCTSLCFAVSGTNLYTGTNGAGVFLSSDYGTTWTAVNTGLTKTYVQSMAVSGLNIFAGTGDGVFISTNNGASWTNTNSDSINIVARSLITSGTNLLAGTLGEGIFLSSDNGTHWTVVNTGLTSNYVWSFVVSDTNLFTGTYNGVYLSNNNGISWNAANSGLENIFVFSLCVLGNNLFAGTIGGGIFLSTTNGSSWAAVNTGLTNLYINSLVGTGGNIYAGTLGGIFLSTNNGKSWSRVDSGFTNPSVWPLIVLGPYLFAGIDSGGVWRRPLKEMLTSSDKFEMKLPGHFSLSQNYPNPFNPSTTISFYLPTKSYVTLKVYDVLGREVSTLVSEELSVGMYSRKWIAEQSSSGVYFYRLQAGAFIESKKILLMR